MREKIKIILASFTVALILAAAGFTVYASYFTSRPCVVWTEIGIHPSWLEQCWTLPSRGRQCRYAGKGICPERWKTLGELAQNERIHFLKIRANDGDLASQLELAAFYAAPETADPREAEKWYLSAAQQGDTKSQLEIGKIFAAHGNAEQAYVWLTIYASRVQDSSLAEAALRLRRQDLFSSEAIDRMEDAAKNWKPRLLRPVTVKRLNSGEE